MNILHDCALRTLATSQARTIALRLLLNSEFSVLYTIMDTERFVVGDAGVDGGVVAGGASASIVFSDWTVDSDGDGGWWAGVGAGAVAVAGGS